MAALVNLVKSALNLKRKDGRCVILGIDSAGKTTFLYKCLLGEIVTTIPTIGFNVETIKVDDYDVTFWDIGGCDKIRPLVRHYFSPGMALLFILNIHDERLGGAMEELHFQVTEAASNFDVAFVGVMLNKQDLPNSTPELREKCRAAVEVTIRNTGFKLNWQIFDSDGLSTVQGQGLDEVLRGVKEGLEGWAARGKKGLEPNWNHTPPSDTPPTAEDIKNRINELKKTRSITYRYSDNFLYKMDQGTLETWDHADHLFVAYSILWRVLQDPSKTTTPQQAVFAAVDIFLEHLTTMLKEATPGKFRNTAHRTLTTFWVNEVYVAMHKIPEPPTGSRLSYWPERFWAFLDSNHHLMYGGLWKDYYTKNYLFSPKAKDSLVMPDIKSLSSFEPKPAKSSTGFDAKKLGEDQTSRRLKRWAYATLQSVKATNNRRGLVVKKALAELQTDTIRQRSKNPMLEPYSETQAYFWIQIVHAGMEGIVRKNPSIDFTRVSFETIDILYPDAFGPDDLWKQYYPEADWKGLPARMNFRPPKNGKVVPNFSPNLVLEEDWRVAVSEVRVPTVEELMQRAGFISNFQPKQTESVKDPETPDPQPISARTITFHENDDDDDWVDLQEPTTKAKVAEAKAPESDSQAPASAEPTPVVNAGPQSWRDHAELLHSIFNSLPKEKSKINHSDISNLAYSQVNNNRSQLTRMTFWVRMIVEAYVATYGPAPTELEHRDTSPTLPASEKISPTLHEFLTKNLELSWEDLWMVYYTELSWNSATANETILGPDRKQLRSVRGNLSLL
ncbi:ADP-ribosylation factor [Drechslerella dactyloides]|uniref:ADP-ribosylation factor n=1 Tax=Drechslerella dactyloides TaxID=74499 RepID=A0AAD6J7A9_DREDA|nr:ADP-ribosylation factor [Drechslerella dactyloides]